MSSSKKFDLIREIQKSSNDDNQSSNFDIMANNKPYTSVDQEKEHVLIKLLNDRMLSVLTKIVNSYLKPKIVWIWNTSSKKRKIYYKYNLLDTEDVLAKISLDNGRLNGITKTFDKFDDKDNEGNLGTETYKNKEYKVSSIRYYLDGKLHRTDGPAIEFVNGTKMWYQNGKYHRVEGPATEYSGNNKHWYQHGKLHRNDGPAREYSNGEKEWYQHGKLHRNDGPAVESSTGSKSWYQNDKLHRINGPAMESWNGTKSWYQNGKLHRIGGPAIEYQDGTKRWYLDGDEYSKSKYDKVILSRSS